MDMLEGISMLLIAILEKKPINDSTVKVSDTTMESKEVNAGNKESLMEPLSFH